MSRDLSHETRELLVLARGDAPPPTSRDNIWDGLEHAILPAAAVGLGTAAATIAKPALTVATSPSAWAPQAAAIAAKSGVGAPVAPAATWVSAIASAKVAVVGALLGTAVAISATVGVIGHRATPQLADDVDAHPAIAYGDDNVIAFHPPSFPARFAGTASPSPSPSPAAPKEAHALQSVARASLTSRATTDDTLLREASLVGEARSALLRGDPQTALVSVQAARREGRNLEPEELSIEARALRALGREPEAAQLDATLRTRYPNNALVR